MVVKPLMNVLYLLAKLHCSVSSGVLVCSSPNAVHTSWLEYEFRITS